MMQTINGWLFDIYPNDAILSVWLIGEDGKRHHFVQDFATTIYAAGPANQLRGLWRWLKAQCIPVHLSRTERKDIIAVTYPTGALHGGDLFRGDASRLPPRLGNGSSAPRSAETADPAKSAGQAGGLPGPALRRPPDGVPQVQVRPPQLVTVLAVEVLQPGKLDELFRKMVDAFPDLTYYDADISVALRHAAQFDTFPLAHCRLEVCGEKIVSITPMDTPWDLDPEAAPLRIMSLEPDCDPARNMPKSIQVSYGRVSYSLPFEKPIPFLIGLRADIRRYDPDVILTSWGDTWLLPFLMKLSQETGVLLPLNRDESQSLVERKEHTYFSYGQIVYTGRQVQLRGRWHIDRHNAMLWGDYGLTGVLEMARVTRQPAQEAARLSPGTGISSMQFVTAMQKGILIPWHKQQAERPKNALEMVRSDMGGMVYQPTVGLHRDVGGIDFVSMYPGIMVRFNILPEVPLAGDKLPRAGSDLEPGPGEPGIIPMTLAPILNKRLALKSALLTLNKYDCRRPIY
jgi:DNA polymerase-2